MEVAGTAGMLVNVLVVEGRAKIEKSAWFMEPCSLKEKLCPVRGSVMLEPIDMRLLDLTFECQDVPFAA
jgi:hypothetical protein